MCKPKAGCRKPDQLRTKPKQCSPAQVQECHGAEKDHPCVPAEKQQ